MTRLQKKCLIAAAGTHLLVLIVVVCSGFVPARQEVDTAEVLNFIPTKAVDIAIQTGAANPTPVVQPPPPQPHQEPPKPVPQIEPPKKVEPDIPQKPDEPPDKDSVEPTSKPKKHQPKNDFALTPTVRKAPAHKENTDEDAKADEQAKQARDARNKAFKNALSTIERNAAPSTKIQMPAGSSVAYANYASIVKTVYTEAWKLPSKADNDDANVQVSVTIARDGRVIEAHIIEPSGDASVDRSIQNTLDRVKTIEAFPDDSSDQQRTYTIDFNLKAKRMLE